ncbi:MAG: substrate-binding domain-containing protein [Bifidobacteriaceae bacterium]|jgi:phosphate transport system substrate-binding protein|nr:substrate-binding domain-containing protein [Bifidobacteriaceae bacterium]
MALGILAVMAPLVLGCLMLGAVVTSGVVSVATRGKTRRVWTTVFACLVFVTAWGVYWISTLTMSEPPVPVWAVAAATFGGLALALVAVWRPFQPRARHIAMAVVGALIVATFGAGVAKSAYESSLLVISDADLQIDLESYKPFAEGTLAASLDQPADLSLTDPLPRLDGATALYPLYSAFVRAVYPDQDYDPHGWLGMLNDTTDPDRGISEVICSSTPSALSNLLSGQADVAFLMGVSESQRREAEATRHKRLDETPIGREAFVFFVSQANPISGLTTDQVRQIYSGEVDNWSQLGGASRHIDAYQRNEGSGSQTALEEIMGDFPITYAPASSEIDSMSGMTAVVLDYKNSPGAIGYSFKYYLDTMIRSDEIKILAIDGVAPSAETIASGEYPFAVEFQAVTATSLEATVDSDTQVARAANTRRLLEWIGSAQGQELVRKTGYVPLWG